ncbi:homeodomain-only protein isoform X2 [Megalopta genalis]|uniref:homeodomain-only protein isoform X2 n=1 Tax=Megalopta genalis TaxID=115081 RepID=UPI0014430DBA|nr:homeodomain-only protein-like isoform X2 [Megalopta genalis]
MIFESPPVDHGSQSSAHRRRVRVLHRSSERHLLHGSSPRRATEKMLRSASPHYPSRGGSDIRVIRLTVDQEAVLQEQFNRWPRAPHTADVVLLAAETGLSEADVEAWYAIRLAQWRKEQGLGGNLGLH